MCAGAVASLPAQIVTLQDGTPVRLRLAQTVTSADAQVGQTVDFEVSEPVVAGGLVIIPKGSLALGKVTKAEPKRRFGRGGALEITVESVRLADSSRAPLRASRDKGAGPMSNGRIAATVAAAPVLVGVKGKDVAFDKGMETTAYINADTRLDAAQLRGGSPPAPGTTPAATPERSAERESGPEVLHNSDILQLHKAGLSDEVILSKIKSSNGDFRTGAQDLIQLKEAGVSDAVISAILAKSGQQ
jgi:hypothetical protein